MNFTEQDLQRFLKRGRLTQQAAFQELAKWETTEKQFQGQVEEFLKLFRWKYYHTWNSENSEEGFPDVIGLRPPRLLVAELKKEGEEPTPAQWDWLDWFSLVGTEVYVWHASDIDEVMKILR